MSSITRFPIRYRWSAYITPKSPKLRLKNATSQFTHIKLIYSIINDCDKVPLCQNFQRSCCRKIFGLKSPKNAILQILRIKLKHESRGLSALSYLFVLYPEHSWQQKVMDSVNVYRPWIIATNMCVENIRQIQINTLLEVNLSMKNTPRRKTSQRSPLEIERNSKEFCDIFSVPWKTNC